MLFRTVCALRKISQRRRFDSGRGLAPVREPRGAGSGTNDFSSDYAIRPRPKGYASLPRPVAHWAVVAIRISRTVNAPSAILRSTLSPWPGGFRPGMSARCARSGRSSIRNGKGGHGGDQNQPGRTAVSPPTVSIPGLALGDAGEFDRRSVGERGDQREATAHGFDRPAQCRQQQVAALLQARDAVLADAESRASTLRRRAGSSPEITSFTFGAIMIFLPSRISTR